MNYVVLKFYHELDESWKKLYELRMKASRGELTREQVKSQATKMYDAFTKSYMTVEPYLNEFKKNDKSIIIFKKLIISLIDDREEKDKQIEENTLTI